MGGSRFWKTWLAACREMPSTLVAVYWAFPRCSAGLQPRAGVVAPPPAPASFYLPCGLCDLGLPTPLSEVLSFRTLSRAEHPTELLAGEGAVLGVSPLCSCD